MWRIGKAVIITNNDWVGGKYKDMMKIVYVESYEEVLLKAKDMVYNRHVLLTHPQASSQKANKTPYRSVIVYPDDGDDNRGDILLIEKCLETFYHSQKAVPMPEKNTERVQRDFKVIDASMMYSIIPRIFRMA